MKRKFTQEEYEFSEKLFNLIRKSPEYHNGWRIPIKTFDIIEPFLRPAMRKHGHRAIYRGPRISNHTRNKPGMTRRCDAKFVAILY